MYSIIVRIPTLMFNMVLVEIDNLLSGDLGEDIVVKVRGYWAQSALFI